MSDCCLIKKVATVEVYENKNEVRAYGFMAGDKNTPMMEVKFRHLWGEENLSKCKLRWIIVDDLGSLLVGEVPIEQDNTASIQLPNELFTGERRMKVQLTVASCDGSRILNLQQFTDLKVINNLASNEVVEPVYQMLINQVYDDTKKYLAELETSYKAKYGSLESVYAKSKASLEQYLITAENGGNAEFLQGYNPKNFNRVENTINELINSASSKYKVGDVVEVLGYYTAGDGAHHKRKIESADDGSGVQLANGLWANIVHNGEVNVSWFGAKRDINESQSSYFQLALKNYPRVTFTGTYYVKDLLCFGAGTLDGITSATSLLRATDDAHFVLGFKHSTKTVFKNFRIDGLRTDGFTKTPRGLQINVLHDRSLLENIRITNCGTGLYCNELWSVMLNNLRIGHCQEGIHVDNRFISNFSLVNGLSNNNSFNGCIIERCVYGIYFTSGFGAQNTFKDFHFEYNKTAVYCDRAYNIVCFDGFTNEGNDISVQIDGGNNASSCMIIKNAMIMPCTGTTKPFPLKINGLETFHIDGFVDFSNTIDHSGINGVFDITNIRYFTTNLSFGIQPDLASRKLEIYKFSSEPIVKNITGITNTIGSSVTNGNKLRHNSKVTLDRGVLYYNEEGESLVDFNSLQAASDDNQFYAYKLKHRKQSGQARTELVFTGLQYNGTATEEVEVLKMNRQGVYVFGTIIPTSYMSLDTPYYSYKMQQENVYEDFVAYIDAKLEYDKEQRYLEEQRQLAFESREDQEQTYEEWLATQPVLIPDNEPQPSEKLLEFKNKYIV